MQAGKKASFQVCCLSQLLLTGVECIGMVHVSLYILAVLSVLMLSTYHKNIMQKKVLTNS